MSYQAVSAVLLAKKPKGIPRLVLVVLAECANKNGVCWPSMPTIAARAAISVRHAKRVVHGLERSGHISIERGKGASHPNRYRILNGDTGVTLLSKQTVTEESPFRDDQTVTKHAKTVTQRVQNGDIAMSPEPVEPPKNQREDAEIAFDDLVKHFEPLFAHLRVRRSLSKMVFEKGWAPTIQNAARWLRIERGCRKKKAGPRRTTPPEPEVDQGDPSEGLIAGSPEAKAAWADALSNSTLGRSIIARSHDPTGEVAAQFQGL